MTYDVYVGMDVGKESNHACAIDAATHEVLFEGEVSQTEHDLRAMLELAREGGRRALLVMDVCGGFGTLPGLVARDMGIDVAHMPSRSFSTAAASYGDDKTDEIDAFVLADATMWRPQLVRLVGEQIAAVEQVKVLSSERAASVAERTRCYNRVHDLLQRLSPPLERVFSGERMHAKIAIELLAKYGGPTGLRRAGKASCRRWAAKLPYQTTKGPRKVEEVFEAISHQTVTPGCDEVLESQVRKLCKRIKDLDDEIAELEAEIDKRTPEIPAVALLTTIPGVGKTTAAVIASQVGDIDRFKDDSALAAYAGVCPKVRKSSKSVDSAKARNRGNKTPRNAITQSAQAALMRDGPAKGYYDKKRGEGKKHSQAIRSLARKRVSLIFAMLTNGTVYEPPQEAAG